MPPLPFTTTETFGEAGADGVDTDMIVTAFGLIVTVKAEPSALQKPDAGSRCCAFRVWVPSDRSVSVETQLPVVGSMCAAPTRLVPSKIWTSPLGMPRPETFAPVLTAPGVVDVTDGADGGIYGFWGHDAQALVGLP